MGNISCTFCDAVDHCVTDCEKHKTMVKRMEQILGTRYEGSLLVMKTSLLMGKHKNFYSHCSMNAHQNEKCWKIHPDLSPKKEKEVMLSLTRKEIGGKLEDDVIPEASFEAKMVQKENP